VLWVFTTLIAAAAQTARNAMQSSLTASLGTLGATQVRFIYGLPFSILFLAGVVVVTGLPVPAANGFFLANTAIAAVAQILGTALLLAAMRDRSFSVATAFTKTEALQVALFGLVILGDQLTVMRSLAIVVATTGVFVAAVNPQEKWTLSGMRPAIYGIASGGLYAIAAIGFRGGIIALGDGLFVIKASTALVWSLAMQSAVLGAWMMAFHRVALRRSLSMWRQSLFAGFMGAFASQFWFLGFSLTSAANVRTLALVEVLFAQLVSRRLLAQAASARELSGMALIVAGVAILLASQ
jgi:drug/metabolite transporter (DMT)-like permease